MRGQSWSNTFGIYTHTEGKTGCEGPSLIKTYNCKAQKKRRYKNVEMLRTMKLIMREARGKYSRNKDKVT